MAVLFGMSRAAARSVCRTLWEAGYSSRSALKLLAKEGFGYPEKLFQRDWREMVGIRQREEFFSRMPKYVRPTRAMMVEKATPLGDKYTYTYRVDLYDPVTKETLKDLNYSIGEDRILTPGEAEAELAERLETETEKGMKYVRGTLISVKRRE